MKKLILIFVALMTISAVNAQKFVKAVTPVDTINGNETVYFPTGAITTSGTLTLQALCTEIGGTSEGTIRLEGSVDGLSWETLTATAGLVFGYPNDTLTIVDAAVGTWVVKENPWKYYRLAGAGAANDSTLVTVKYIISD